MKKLTSILLAVLMLTSVFVSCVGDDNTTTTDIPITEAPTTEAPTTEAPTTEAPTTEAPTTETPTTEAPTTEAPTTEEPTVEPGIEYNIFYELNGGTNNPENPDTYVTGKYLFLGKPEKENCVFAGWYTDPEFTNKIGSYISKDSEGDVTLYAKWSDIYGALILEPEGDSYTIVDCDVSLEFEGIPSSFNGKPITKIGDHAFGDCLNIKSVVIPDSITYIGSGAFKRCSNIEEITIPDSVTYIGSGAFYRCNGLTSIIIPDSVTYIGSYAFDSCNHLTSITIPDSVTYIGYGAFYNCSGITSITIPNTSEVTFDKVLAGCYNLVEITLGPGVSSIEGMTVTCPKLSKINVSEENNSFCTVDGVLYSKDGKKLICFPASLNISTFEIPEGVTEIGDQAFAFTRYVDTIKLPKTLNTVTRYAFYNFNSLEQIIVDKEHKDFKTIGGVLLSKDGTKLIKFPAGNKTTNYTIPEGVTSIEKFAFEYSTGLKQVIIPKTVNKIGEGAFKECHDLESVEIPDGVTQLEGETFAYCEKLKTVSLPDSIKTFGKGEFINCASLKSIKLPDGLTDLGEYAFSYCSELDEINIPSGIDRINSYAFLNCKSLKLMQIPENITTIESHAFMGCNRFAKIFIPLTVSNISNDAFEGCNTILYCEARKLPENWYYGITSDVMSIIWGATLKDFTSL